MTQELFPPVLKRPLAAIFALATFAAFTPFDVAAQRSDAAYVNKRINALPKARYSRKIRADSHFARAYTFWHKAAGETGICMDVDTITRDRGVQGKFGVGPEIARALQAIPKDGVDANAVQAVHHLAEGLQVIQELNNKPGPNAGQRLLAALSGLVGHGDPPPDAEAEMRAAATAAQKAEGTGNATQIYRDLNDWHQVGWAVQEELDAARAELTKKYKIDFPRIYILEPDPKAGKATIFSNVAGACRM